MTAERNRFRAEAAEAERQADKLTQRLSAIPKARAPSTAQCQPCSGAI